MSKIRKDLLGAKITAYDLRIGGDVVVLTPQGELLAGNALIALMVRSAELESRLTALESRVGALAASKKPRKAPFEWGEGEER